MALHTILAQSRQIVVVRVLQLGDMLTAVPALRALRAARPSATITLLGLPWAESFVRRFAHYVDEFIAAPGYPGVVEQPADVRRLPAFFTAMHRRRFDLALQMHGNGLASNGFTLQLGARTAAGHFTPGAWRPADTFWPYPSHLPEVHRHLRLLDRLGADATDAALEFPITDDDRGELERVGGGELDAADYVCVHPGARDPSRRWPAQSFAAVADAFHRAGMRVVLTGVADETATMAAVRDAMETRPLDLTGRLTLGGLGALLAGARLVICNDTGVSHLADALRVRSVVIFSASDPARWAPLDGALHRVVRASAVERPDPCCLGETCVNARFVPLDVPPEAVVQTAKQLLQGDSRRAA